MRWFDRLFSHYKCKICLEDFRDKDNNLHGKGICKDKRGLWDTRIIKKNSLYIVQNKYMFSSLYNILPVPYWEDYAQFKTLKKARQCKLNILENNDMNIVG